MKYKMVATVLGLLASSILSSNVWAVTSSGAAKAGTASVSSRSTITDQGVRHTLYDSHYESAPMTNY